MIPWIITDPKMDIKTGWGDFREYKTGTRSYYIHKHGNDYYWLTVYKRNNDGEDVQHIYERTNMRLVEVENQIMIFEAASAIGRKGGQAKSAAKTAAARENAKKPRPRKKD